MSKNPAVLLLEHHLKELKLPTFLRDYDTRRTFQPPFTIIKKIKWSQWSGLTRIAPYFNY